MNVAVLTLTRDRLDYTKHCFAALREFAGCEYDHFVFDNGSTDGTVKWILDEYLEAFVIFEATNIGVNHGLNRLLDDYDFSEYDAIVKIDNDCELTEPNTLRDVCELALAGDAILSPRILGLRNPPAPIGEFEINGEKVLELSHIGGCFLAAPAWVYDEYRHREDAPIYGSDDGDVCGYMRFKGKRCGYVERLTANHYETTEGQEARYPEYWARKMAEMGR